MPALPRDVQNSPKPHQSKETEVRGTKREVGREEEGEGRERGKEGGGEQAKGRRRASVCVCASCVGNLNACSGEVSGGIGTSQTVGNLRQPPSGRVACSARLIDNNSSQCYIGNKG